MQRKAFVSAIMVFILLFNSCKTSNKTSAENEMYGIYPLGKGYLATFFNSATNEITVKINNKKQKQSFTNISSVIRSLKNNTLLILSANEQKSFSCWEAKEKGLTKISDECFSAIPEDTGLSVAYTVAKNDMYFIQTTDGQSYGPFEEVYGLYRYTAGKGLVYIVKENARYTLYVDNNPLTEFYPRIDSDYPIACTVDSNFDNIRLLYENTASQFVVNGLTEEIFGKNSRTNFIKYSPGLWEAGIYNPNIENYETDTIAIENFDAGTGYCIINKSKIIFSTKEKYLAKALLDNPPERLSIAQNFLGLGNLTLPAPKNINPQTESYGLLKFDSLFMEGDKLKKFVFYENQLCIQEKDLLYGPVDITEIRFAFFDKTGELELLGGPTTDGNFLFMSGGLQIKKNWNISENGFFFDTISNSFSFLDKSNPKLERTILIQQGKNYIGNYGFMNEQSSYWENNQLKALPENDPTETGLFSQLPVFSGSIQPITPTDEIIIGDWVDRDGSLKITFTKEGTFSYTGYNHPDLFKKFNTAGYSGKWRIQNGKLEFFPQIKKICKTQDSMYGPRVTGFIEEKIEIPNWITLNTLVLEESGRQYFLKFKSNDITKSSNDTFIMEASRFKLSP